MIIPDYARFYKPRQGLTYYQVWVLEKLFSQLKNGLGRTKKTWDDIEEGIEKMAHKLTLEDYFNDLKRSSKTA